MFSIDLTLEQLRLLEALLRPRVTRLNRQLAEEIQHLPPGNGGWADTTEELAVTVDALRRVRNALIVPR